MRFPKKYFPKTVKTSLLQFYDKLMYLLSQRTRLCDIIYQLLIYRYIYRGGGGCGGGRKFLGINYTTICDVMLCSKIFSNWLFILIYVLCVWGVVGGVVGWNKVAN